MATALIIARDRGYGAEAFPAFRARQLFPVVVVAIDTALALLRQFRADVIVIEMSGPEMPAADRERLLAAAPSTPQLALPRLPPPDVLAARLADLLSGGPTTPDTQTGGGSRASSSSRGGSSVSDRGSPPPRRGR